MTWILWTVWIACAAGFELFNAPNDLWYWLLGTFVIMEGWALADKKGGNSLSETVWKWNGGKPGRALGSASFGAWLTWHLYILTPGGAYVDAATHHAVGPALFCLTVAVWLVPHFYTRGASG